MPTSENTQETSEEKKTHNKLTQNRIGRHGTAPLPPRGAAVDGTNDVHWIGLSQQKKFFLIVWCFPKVRIRIVPLDGRSLNTHFFKHTRTT